jgi:hypothetical protein
VGDAVGLARGATVVVLKCRAKSSKE